MALRVRIESTGGAPEERVLEHTDVVIGRIATAGLVIADASVSRQHARLTFENGAWWVEALSATNPTLLNDATIDRPHRVVPGDLLRMGTSAVRVLGAPEPPRPAPSPAPTQPTASDDRQSARLDILNEVHRALATAISLPGLLDLILERCFSVLAPEEGVILLRTSTGSLEPAATRQRMGGAGPIHVSRRLIDEVAGKGKPALVMDAAADERLAGSESIIMSGVRSVVAAPLSDGDGALGLIVLSSRAGVRQFTQHDLDLLVSLASAAALRVRNVALAEEAAERRVLERELAIAHDMQMSMLPKPMPDQPQVSVAATLKPARSVGGDLYDYWLAGDRLWFIVADVAGHGVGAALYMAVVKALFRASAHGDVSIAEVAARMNREIARDNDSMLFVTAMFGTLMLATGDVTMVDAGHNPAVVVSPDGRLHSPAISKGVALGVVEDFEFTEGRFHLAPDTTLMLYTDGATDARSSAEETFGADRLMTAIRNADSAPAVLVSSVTAAIDAFAAGAPQEDDITLLAIRRKA
jgi:sigma-B regulation protein RsbU (phosphoserine phosphatase)